MNRALIAAVAVVVSVFFSIPTLANTCGDIHFADLIADGGDTATVIGTVTVSNDDQLLCVDIEIEEDQWKITEVNIHTAESSMDIPTNKKGTSAVPGDFETVLYYEFDENKTYLSHCEAIQDIYDGADLGGSLVVAVHVDVAQEVCKKEGKACKVIEEGAWADGNQFSEYSGWDTYMGGLQIQTCGVVECPCFSATEIHLIIDDDNWHNSNCHVDEPGEWSAHIEFIDGVPEPNTNQILFEVQPDEDSGFECSVYDSTQVPNWQASNISETQAERCVALIDDAINYGEIDCSD